jgi:hypothetical protein
MDGSATRRRYLGAREEFEERTWDERGLSNTLESRRQSSTGQDPHFTTRRLDIFGILCLSIAVARTLGVFLNNVQNQNTNFIN